MSEEASLKTFENMKEAEAKKWFEVMLERIAGYKEVLEGRGAISLLTADLKGEELQGKVNNSSNTFMFLARSALDSSTRRYTWHVDENGPKGQLVDFNIFVPTSNDEITG